jgi:hypothetical protein
VTTPTNQVPNGTIQQGQIWTPAQWNTAWQSKVDASGGFSTNETLTTPDINDPTIVGGTQASPAITTPTVTGGTFSDPEITNPTVIGTITSPTFITDAAPQTAWMIDFTNGATNGNEITLANGAGITLPPGSGLVFIYSITAGVPNSMGYAFLVFGNVVITNVTGSLYNNVSGAAGTVNIFFNDSSAYEIVNNIGSSVTLAISTLRLRSIA